MDLRNRKFCAKPPVEVRKAFFKSKKLKDDVKGNAQGIDHFHVLIKLGTATGIFLSDNSEAKKKKQLF